MTTMMDDNLLSDVNVAEPYPALARMLAEGPVRWSDAHRAWMVLGYDEFTRALKEPAFSSDRVRPVYNSRLSDQARGERAPTFEVLQHWMVFNDPPNHTRLRKLVSSAFTPRSIARLEPRVGQIVVEAVDALQGKDRIDFIHEFAFPIPAVVIAEFLGVPAGDREIFKEWSNCIMTLVFGGATTPDRRERGQQGLLELGDYLRPRIAAARTDAADNLIGMLATAHEDDDTLSEDEIVATCVLLLFAGHETTTNLIGNGTRALLDHPAQMARFRSEPELTRSAIEEILRFDGPSKLEMRRVASDVTFEGVDMRAGDQVLLLQAAANRDGKQFPSPDEFDIARDPNRHVGFGFGLHHCLGAALARMEGAIALRALVDRFPSLTPTGALPTWHEVIVSRGMETYEVDLGTPR